MISGREMCRHLIRSGVPVQKVVRKQATGHYIAEFYVPDMDDATAPANEWAQQIRNVLPAAKIIDTHDTIAVWRPGKPVIFATVAFQWAEEESVA